MLSVRSLTRYFGRQLAVDSVSFDVPAGQVVGFVGANGAGKSTTMRMVLGVLAIHGGEVLWDDRPITSADRRRFGYMPEERGLYPKQPIRGQLVYLGQLRGLSRSEAGLQVDHLLDVLGLTGRAQDRLEMLSLGNQQRVQIAAALLNQPKALVLDEPFSGLDPAAVDAMMLLLRAESRRGVPILLSSHQLELIESVCDRLVILREGRVAAQGPPEVLKRQKESTHLVRLTSDAGWLRDLPGLRVVDLSGKDALLQLGDWSPDALLRTVLERAAVVELREVTPTLSEIYREVTS